MLLVSQPDISYLTLTLNQAALVGTEQIRREETRGKNLET